MVKTENKSIEKLISEMRRDINGLTNGFTITSLGENFYGRYDFTVIFRDGKAKIIELQDKEKGIHQTFEIKNDRKKKVRSR